MQAYERIQHFITWTNQNGSLFDDLEFKEVMELYDIFKDFNPDYHVQNVLQEHEDTDEVIQRYNAFADKHKTFNKYINGEWITQ